MQARHEYKHSLNYCDYIVLKNKLNHLMERDKNAGENGAYKVRSIYYDTPNDKALREKIDGVDNREKFRIRRYIGNSDQVFLEKKSKIHGVCYKESLPLERAQAESLLSGDIGWMAGRQIGVFAELYMKITSERLMPKTVVDYIREPFFCKTGNVRVTFDTDIRTGLFSTNFMLDSLPTIKAGDGLVLLEVKYDQFIPDYIVKALQLWGRQASSVSKYALCRMYG